MNVEEKTWSTEIIMIKY